MGYGGAQHPVISLRWVVAMDHIGTNWTACNSPPRSLHTNNYICNKIYRLFIRLFERLFVGGCFVAGRGVGYHILIAVPLWYSVGVFVWQDAQKWSKVIFFIIRPRGSLPKRSADCLRSTDHGLVTSGLSNISQGSYWYSSTSELKWLALKVKKFF